MLRSDPRRVYSTYALVGAFISSAAWATIAIYRFKTAGLSPFELVIVGTAMEASVFVAEIPTGVIADVLSRRLSVIIGILGMGVGMIAEGAFPSFWAILFAQVFWGISYTFTSGALEAWLAGEIGEEAFGEEILRVARFTYPAALVGTLVSFAIADWSLRAPVIGGGVVSLLLGVYLIVAMPETGFTRSNDGDRSPSKGRHWATMARTTREGLGSITRRRALLVVLVAILLWGAASEAFDRLMQPHLLDGVGVPGGESQELFWLGALSVASIVVGYVVVSIASKRKWSRRPDVLRLVTWFAVGEAVATVVLGLAGGFAVAAVAVLGVRLSRSLRQRLLMGWVIPHTEPATRATALSAFGQADAFGQSLIGPAFGVIGSVASLPAAITASAGVLALTPALVVVAGATAAREADPSTTPAG